MTWVLQACSTPPTSTHFFVTLSCLGGTMIALQSGQPGLFLAQRLVSINGLAKSPLSASMLQRVSTLPNQVHGGFADDCFSKYSSTSPRRQCPTLAFSTASALSNATEWVPGSTLCAPTLHRSQLLTRVTGKNTGKLISPPCHNQSPPTASSSSSRPSVSSGESGG